MNQNKEKWEEDFEEKYCNFEISERISKPDMLNIKSFIRSLLLAQKEEFVELLKKHSLHDAALVRGCIGDLLSTLKENEG
mgnify:CR=1 FL=1